MRQMRYQYLGPNGIEWTKWFDYNGPEDPIQYKGSHGLILLNQYRDKENETE